MEAVASGVLLSHFGIPPSADSGQFRRTRGAPPRPTQDVAPRFRVLTHPRQNEAEENVRLAIRDACCGMMWRWVPSS